LTGAFGYDISKTENDWRSLFRVENPTMAIQLKTPRMGLFGCVIFNMLVVFLCLWAAPLSALNPESADIHPPVQITEGWTYRLGDSPRDEDGKPLWTYQNLDSPEWRPTSSTRQIPGAIGENLLWLRVPLPDGTWNDPTVFLPRVYLNLEVYLESELIYSFGKLEPSYSNRFSAFVPHRILLPNDFQRKFLFFRIFTGGPQINGIDGIVLLGSREEVLLHAIKQNILQILVGIFCVFIGLFSILLYLDPSIRGAFAPLIFGIFSSSIGVAFLVLSPSLLLLVRAPEFYYWALFLAFLIFPPALLAFVDQVIGTGYRDFIRRLWQFHLFIMTIAIVLEIFVKFPMPYWMDYLRFLWIFDCLVIVAAGVYASIKGRFEARVFTVGIAFFSSFAIYDIFSEGKRSSLMPVGTLVFILLLAYILYRRFTESSRRLKAYSRELEEKSEKLAEAKAQLEEYSRTLEQKVEERTREVKEKQAQLIQSSKMAALGSLVAGVAHEINTPVGAINSMHNTLMRAVENVRSDIDDCLEETRKEREKIHSSLGIIDDANKVIQSGTERVIEIVNRLRSFARLDEAELKDADINEGIEDTLTIIHHQIKHDITVIKNYGDIPKISCFPGRLNQVFLNLLINARQAIKGKGAITISTYAKNNKVYVEFKDTGKGIAREDLTKIFDPGFTTKGVGVGTGLGLSICYQIIQDHRGEILVESEVGKGTTFTVILPMNLEKRLEAD
jgi:signal transduction histidine kinase